MSGNVTITTTGLSSVIDLRSALGKWSAYSFMVGLSSVSTSTGSFSATFDVIVSNDPRMLSTAPGNSFQDTLNSSAVSLAGTGTGTIGDALAADTVASLIPYAYAAIRANVLSTDAQLNVYVRS